MNGRLEIAMDTDVITYYIYIHTHTYIYTCIRWYFTLVHTFRNILPGEKRWNNPMFTFKSMVFRIFQGWDCNFWFENSQCQSLSGSYWAGGRPSCGDRVSALARQTAVAGAAHLNGPNVDLFVQPDFPCVNIQKCGKPWFSKEHYLHMVGFTHLCL